MVMDFAAAVNADLHVRNQVQHGSEHAVGVITILEARPEADLPGHRPAGASVATHFQRALGGSEQLGRAAPGDLPTGVQAEHMRAVTVVIVGVVPILKPLLKLAIPANLQRVEPGARGL